MAKITTLNLVARGGGSSPARNKSFKISLRRLVYRLTWNNILSRFVFRSLSCKGRESKMRDLQTSTEAVLTAIFVRTARVPNANLVLEARDAGTRDVDECGCTGPTGRFHFLRRTTLAFPRRLIPHTRSWPHYFCPSW